MSFEKNSAVSGLDFDLEAMFFTRLINTPGRAPLTDCDKRKDST